MSNKEEQNSSRSATPVSAKYLMDCDKIGPKAKCLPYSFFSSVHPAETSGRKRKGDYFREIIFGSSNKVKPG